ncbi:MAG: hypothetical protein JJT96_20460, partial [Opitutales bacterium]|nr:hypothetical protein [Opitutales bacterium]
MSQISSRFFGDFCGLPCDELNRVEACALFDSAAKSSLPYADTSSRQMGVSQNFSEEPEPEPPPPSKSGPRFGKRSYGRGEAQWRRTEGGFPVASLAR